MITTHLPVSSLAALSGMVIALAIGLAAGLALALPGDDLTTVEACTGGTIDLNGHEKRMLDLHNQTRAGYGLGSLCVHPILTEAARSHSETMLDEGDLSHYSPNGDDTEARLMRFGYTPAGYSYWAYGENLAWGTGDLGDPDPNFGEWMDSADHRVNILDKDFSEIGIGAITDAYGTGTTYTIDFGTRY